MKLLMNAFSPMFYEHSTTDLALYCMKGPLMFQEAIKMLVFKHT